MPFGRKKWTSADADAKMDRCILQGKIARVFFFTVGASTTVSRNNMDMTVINTTTDTAINHARSFSSPAATTTTTTATTTGHHLTIKDNNTNNNNDDVLCNTTTTIPPATSFR